MQARCTAKTILVVLSMTSWTSAQTPPSEWRIGLGIRESRQLGRIVNGVATGNRIVDNVNAIFGYSTNRPRSSLSLFGRVGVNVPRDSEQRNRANFGLGLGWNHSFLYTPETRAFRVLFSILNYFSIQSRLYQV